MANDIATDPLLYCYGSALVALSFKYSIFFFFKLAFYFKKIITIILFKWVALPGPYHNIIG